MAMSGQLHAPAAVTIERTVQYDLTRYLQNCDAG